jgi:predicted secreted protein
VPGADQRGGYRAAKGGVGVQSLAQAAAELKLRADAKAQLRRLLRHRVPLLLLRPAALHEQ